jgi:hypothetical protein
VADIPVKIYRTSTVRSGTAPSNPAEVEGEVFAPVNPPGSGNTTLYKLLGDVTDQSFIGKNGFVPVVNSENFLTLQPLPNFNIDGLISGGVVQWTGTGYVFNVSSAIARFQGQLINSSPDLLTLTTADGTNPRIDVFILQVLFDGNGVPIGMEADFITGTPASTPVKPQIDPSSQIELTQILVPALSTTPSLTEDVIYSENVEWVGSSSGSGTVNFASTSAPYTGSFSIETSNIQNNSRTILTRSSNLNLSSYQTLGFQIRLKASMGGAQNIGISFLNVSGTQITNELFMTLDKSISGVYQFVGISLSAFSFTSPTTEVRAIQFRFLRASGSVTFSGYFLDVIKLEGGINPPVQFGTFLSLGDTPSSYSGQGGKSVAVKADESGLEFVTSGGGGGVQSVTGDGVDNTDPDNPVLTFPTPAQLSVYTIAESDPLASTGSVIQFDQPRTYNGNLAPNTNTVLTENNTPFRKVTQVIFHQAASFTPPSTWEKSTGSDAYDPAKVNIIYVEAFDASYKRYIIDHDE